MSDEPLHAAGVGAGLVVDVGVGAGLVVGVREGAGLVVDVGVGVGVAVDVGVGVGELATLFCRRWPAATATAGLAGTDKAIAPSAANQIVATINRRERCGILGSKKWANPS